MSFRIYYRKQSRVYFLDVENIYEDKKVLSTANQLLSPFLKTAYKFGTISILSHNCFCIYSSETNLHTELLFPKQIFAKKNGYFGILKMNG